MKKRKMPAILGYGPLGGREGLSLSSPPRRLWFFVLIPASWNGWGRGYARLRATP
jgi:hypothetical protein